MRKWGWVRIVAAGAALLPAAAGAQDCAGDDGRIDWEVRERFALFRGEAARKAGDDLLDRIERAGGNLVDGSPAGDPGRADAYQAIVDALTRPGEDALYLNTHYERSTGRYSEEADFLTPPSYKIVARFAGETGASCVWTVAGRSTSGKCSEHELRVDRDWTRPAAATAVEVRSASGRSARACILVEEKLILGLGDSYASGEGNPDRPTQWRKVPGLVDGRRPMRDKRSQLLWWPSRKGPLRQVPKAAGADAQWWDNVCHRSLLSQQALAAMAYAARSRRRVTTFLSFACSGATIVDGLVGPRVDTPGMGWLTPEQRRKSPPLTQSQVKQAVTALCRDGPSSLGILTLPPEAQAWEKVRPQYAGTEAGQFEIPGCADWRRRPDILLLTIGGNDVGFGGVGWWAIVPPNSRVPLPADLVTWINTDHDRSDPNKPDFGVVCPRTYFDERRCRASDYSAQDLAGQLPALQSLADEMLAKAGLEAPVRIKTGYPPVTRDEFEKLCGTSWSLGSQYQLEPWASAYALVLDKARLFRVEWAAPFKNWSWGIHNKVTEDRACPRLSNPAQQEVEICEIDNFVLDSLNRAVLAPRPGWANVDQDRLPRTHGICASELPREGMSGKEHLAAYRREWGFPRWGGEGWNDSYPTPFEWQPYARRRRWVRTGNDSILTQAVFFGGSANPDKAQEELRRSESNSGSLHATAEMHAAYAELLVEAIERLERSGRR